MSAPAVELCVVSQSNADLLGRVAPDVFDHPVQPELVRSFLANPANLLVVAVANGVVVGMASGMAYVHPDKPLQLFINEVGVSASFQRQGLGRRLMQELLKQGRALGCGEAWVATEPDNVPARSLYASMDSQPAQEAVVYVYALDDPQAAADDPGRA